MGCHYICQRSLMLPADSGLGGSHVCKGLAAWPSVKEKTRTHYRQHSAGTVLLSLLMVAVMSQLPTAMLIDSKKTHLL